MARINWNVMNPNKLTFHIPGSQAISDLRKATSHLDLAFKHKEDNIVLSGFNHVANFSNEIFNKSTITIRIQQGELIQDGCYLQLEKTALVYLEDVNLLPDNGFLVTYVSYEFLDDGYITDDKFRLGMSYVNQDGSDIGPIPWSHVLNKTVLNIYKFKVENNKITELYEYEEDNIVIDGQVYYKKGYEPRVFGDGESQGDMVKAIYDMNNNNIVDRAERLDDGHGNIITTLQIINGLNSIPSINDSLASTTQIWSSHKIQTEINTISSGVIEWTSILNKPDLYTQSQIDGFLIAKSNIGHGHDWVEILNKPSLYTRSEIDGLLSGKSDVGHTHTEYVSLDDSAVFTDKGWSSYKIQEEINNISSGVIEWTSILNKPAVFPTNEANIVDLDKYTQAQIDGFLSGKSDVGHLHDDRYSLLTHQHDWTEILNTPLVYTQSQIDGFLSSKSDTGHLHDDRYSLLSHTHTEYVSLDDSGVFTDKGWSSYKIQEEINNISSGVIEWTSILNKPAFFPTNEASIVDLDKYTQVEVNGLLSTKSDVGHLHDDRYPVLDASDKIPSHYIPSEFKESLVVNNITERNAVSDIYEGLRIHVIDASDDPTVNSGGAGYIYHSGGWSKIYEEESIDVVLDWNSLINIPTSFPSDPHTHTESQITDLDKYTQVEVNGLLSTKSDVGHLHDDRYSLLGHDHDSRYPVLDGENKIPVTYLYAENHIVVEDIIERNTIPNPENGTKVFVKDASGDPEITSGNAGYMYYDGSWIRTHSEESLNLSQQWDDILNKPDLYTQSQIDGFLSNKSDVGHLHDDRYSLLTHQHDWTEILNRPSVYTQSQIDGFLSNKSDVGHIHDISHITNLQTELNNRSLDGHTHTLYLEKTENLLDLANRQTALNNLTGVDTALEDQVLTKDSGGNAIWKAVTGSGSSTNIGDEILIQIGPGNTIAERSTHPDTKLPVGWILTDGSDPQTDGNSGSNADTLVIIHNTGKFVATLSHVEYRHAGMPSNQGYVQMPNSEVIQWKSNNDRTHIIMQNVKIHMNPNYYSYLYVKLVSLPE